MASVRTFVTMTLDKEDLDEVVGIFETFIKDVQEKDYGVLTYHYFVDDGDRPVIHVFEEYESSKAHLDHFANIDMTGRRPPDGARPALGPALLRRAERRGAGAAQGLRQRPLSPAADQHRGTCSAMTVSTLEFQPEAERYYAQGYWQDGDLWSDFDARSREHAGRVALVLEDRAVTYAELRRAAVALSHRLADAGVGAGEVVILLGRHSIEAAVAMLGCLHRGVVLAPLPPMFNQTQMAALAEQTNARAIVTFGGEKEVAKCREVAGDRLPLLTVVPADVDRAVERDDARMPRHADEVALVLHSSGTTSAPKGIAHSSNTLRYATRGVCSRWGLTGEDIYLTVVEFGFVGGLVFGYLPVLLQGATGVLLSRWDPEEALRLIEAHGCTYVLAMPTHATDMIVAAEQTERDLSSMRVLAGPGLSPERRMAMHQAFGTPPLGDYGLSEVPGHAAHAPDDPPAKIMRTEGRPYDGTEIRIVGDDGEPVPAGHGRRGRGQRPEPLPRLPQQRRPDAHVADGVGRL